MFNGVKQQRDYQLLSKIFSRSVILDIAKKGRFTSLEKILNELNVNVNVSNKPIRMIYDLSFSILSKQYRNEYFFKNVIAKKIIKGRHKLSNVSYINEFKVSSSIADIAIFNGTSTAYEIKTEYDSFERLDSQLMSYQRVFENVYVVVPESKVEQVATIIQPNIGIYALTERDTLKECRVAKSNIDILSKEMMFNSLRFSEYIELCEKKFCFTPAGKASEQKKKCLELFLKLDNDIAHHEFLLMLKKRALKSYEKEVFNKLPESLLAAVLNLRLNKKTLANLQLSMEGNLEI